MPHQTQKKTCSMISSAGELNGSAMSMAWLACTDFVLLAGSIVILSTWIKKGRKALYKIKAVLWVDIIFRARKYIIAHSYTVILNLGQNMHL